MAYHKRHVARVWVGCGWRTEVSRTVKQFFVAVPGGELSFLLPNTWTAHCGVSLTARALDSDVTGAVQTAGRCAST